MCGVCAGRSSGSGEVRVNFNADSSHISQGHSPQGWEDWLCDNPSPTLYIGLVPEVNSIFLRPSL